MVLIQPEAKALFEEVIAFLTKLDKANLSKPLSSEAHNLKQKIEDLCPPENVEDEELYDEAMPDVVTKPEDEKGDSPTSNSKDEAEIRDASVASLENPTKQGFLEKRRPDSFMTKLAPYQRRYCVIHQGICYYFDNQNAKKQSGAFYLKDYEARTAYRLIKSVTRKEGSFETVAPGQRTYQFLAKDFEEMKQWIEAVAKWSEHKHAPVSSIARPDDALDKTSTVSSGSDSGSIGGISPGVGEVADASDSKRRRLPPPINPVVDEEQELYDEAGPDENQELYDEGEPTVTPVPEDDEERYDCVEEETYDEAEVEVKRAPAPAPKRPVPAPPESVGRSSKSRPLPPPPARKTINVRSDDFGNQFYGLWDCDTSVVHELSFKSGDIIHVVDREHDVSGWWTAILDGMVGLVPKSYLTPAYAAH